MVDFGPDPGEGPAGNVLSKIDGFWPVPARILKPTGPKTIQNIGKQKPTKTTPTLPPKTLLNLPKTIPRRGLGEVWEVFGGGLGWASGGFGSPWDSTGPDPGGGNICLLCRWP